MTPENLAELINEFFQIAKDEEQITNCEVANTRVIKNHVILQLMSGELFTIEVKAATAH